MEQVLIGQNAGIIWHLLEGKNGVEVSHLKKESKLSEAEFWAAIGWLSKEDKLTFSTEKVGKKTVKTYSLKD
ncbi:winged helix-turn-helix domain-containing protein [Phocaeicola vulgatus]|jgi:hypothetical protein|uniref:winged helix-turn-helix domain-containing protein n=1 Tax=Phocaeicola vulgatus TaxID=821 RepID=UPI001F21D129|nr:winged helix-turn-helix domain-containing protein [Phocaeicola vulgatus]MCG0155253.1 winged helix-turn-helix domain-containing protein [Phocaeicola vulgatus]MCG0329189.1 winged helix-turn-helix domain-containing protein [Phocaeicola vulgatus]MCG0333074.1 winged helix-turn-helix domain-containing protein [Phocaeicola vulgatus]